MRVMPAAAPAPPPEPEPEPEPPPVVAAEAELEPETAPEPPMPQEGLLAPAPAAEAVALLSGLVRTLAAERGAQVHRGGPTIEDLVREEIRPLLKSWLDQHLPSLVQRLVQAEIERVANRAMP
jgi:cell pole-organizing protein PopZ